MTVGSTATIPGPTGRPVAVVPGSAYAVATTVRARPWPLTGGEGAAGAAGAGVGAIACCAAIVVRALLRCVCLLLERRDLPLVQLALALEVGEVAPPLGLRRLEIRCRRGRLLLERGQPVFARGQRRPQPDERAAGPPGLEEHALVLAGERTLMVEIRDRVAERLGAEQDRQCIRTALLVDVHEPLPEVPPRDPQHSADQGEPVPDRGALSRDGVDLRAQRIDAGLLFAQPALERVELDEGRMRLRGEARILLSEIVDAARIGADRGGDEEDEKRAERACQDGPRGGLRIERMGRRR